MMPTSTTRCNTPSLKDQLAPTAALDLLLMACGSARTQIVSHRMLLSIGPSAARVVMITPTSMG
jgi:hypothetical protein